MSSINSAPSTIATNPTPPPLFDRNYVETDEENSQRFLMELEFVQALSNPQYLQFLALNRFFQEKAFINYLQYLLYWKKPEYARYLVYPQSLHFLELLQDETFRRQLLSKPFVEMIHAQQFYHWRFYGLNRLAISTPSPAIAPATATTTSTSNNNNNNTTTKNG
jgi:mediator of RNA polymerase II transcription subunit 31